MRVTHERYIQILIVSAVNGLFLDYLVRYRWRWVAGVLLTMCSTGFGLVSPTWRRSSLVTPSAMAAGQAVDILAEAPPSA
jgi:hypothetical protein